ncbi:MAG: phosphatidylserine decarboxylase [Oscillospiraceae bacterium]|nr:phosphatidylserine decarboxylase [Oscillospiraceae bacterium]
MNRPDQVWVFDGSGYVREKIPAEGLLRLLYHHPIGGAPLLFLARRKAVSRLYGTYCKTAYSAKKIPQFINDYRIDMTGCTGDYANFAQFFSREKSGVRFPAGSNVLGAPCEGMAFAYRDIDPEKLIAAKGSFFTLAELFGSRKLAENYRGGSMVAIRLNPTNYHRMHFFDDGHSRGSKLIDGDLLSVNPLAVRNIARLYCQNKRVLTLFSSKNFGQAAIVEVGATFIGSIVHLFTRGDRVRRGEQASYFLPGGSLVLFFFEAGKFSPAATLLEQTAAGYETIVQIGQPIGNGQL